MCNNTKQRIADALRQLMTERPFDKITVQNLMDMTQMKRQSFYYHFQDTRDVLMWICVQDLIDPLVRSDAALVDWLLQGAELLDRDRRFYRKVVKVAYVDFAKALDGRALRPRITALLYPGRSEQLLTDNERFAVDIAIQAARGRFIQFIHSHDPLDLQTTRERIEYLLDRFVDREG